MTSKRAAAHAINFILEIEMCGPTRSDSDEEHRTVHGDEDGDNHGRAWSRAVRAVSRRGHLCRDRVVTVVVTSRWLQTFK